ncbi:MAG: cupin domain-containing protein [Halieaceae bacterium]|nr:cupin domain-containing protein [Halieaceae bacterium]
MQSMLPRAVGALALFATPVLADSLPDPLAAGWEGESVCECLHRDERVRLLRCTFPPGVGHERHFHPPHVGYVIEGGRMQITNAEGTRVQDVPTGISFSNPEGIPWHEAVNIGDSTASYLMIEPATETGAPLGCPDR